MADRYIIVYVKSTPLIMTLLHKRILLSNCSLSRLFQLHNNGKLNSDISLVPINVAIWGDGSEYPKDAMDGMTLSLKEAAKNCNLDSLVEVCFFFVFWTSDLLLLLLSCHPFPCKNN